MRATCDHAVRLVNANGRAVMCGRCGAALEVSEEDLARLAAAPPPPPYVGYVAYDDDDPTEKYA